MKIISKLAVASFVLSLVSFIQLFGIEKAILSIILGVFALKEILNSQEELKGKNYAYAGIIFGSLYILVLLVFVILKGPEIFKLLSHLR
ncbi:MAG: DUF4190 domain-containing protein [Elusimicrobia bacterium]|nr:DUF4190 domain-containing protein [Elusimicrobiota bacterium]